MDFSRLGEIATSLGMPTWDPATWLFVLLMIVLAIYGLSKAIKRMTLSCKSLLSGEIDKTYPPKLHATCGDISIILERRWLDGGWRWVLYELPISLWPPDEYNELNKSMRAPEEKWLANLDVLTKEGGPIDQAVKKSYGQPERIDRRKLASYFFRWRGIMPKIDPKAQQRENERRMEEAAKPFSAETK